LFSAEKFRANEGYIIMKIIKINLLLLSVVFILLIAGSAQAQLNYREDAVVVRADMIPAISGTAINVLSLMRFNGKNFEPIPFQIDEKTKDNNFVYTNGQKKNPQDGNNKFDGKDELVFMAWDSGALAPPNTKFPENSISGVQILLTDYVRNNSGAVYLFVFSANPPLSKIDYVQNLTEEGRNVVKTERYYFGEPIGKGYFDRLALIGPDGKVGPNLVDRIKGRGHIQSMGVLKFNAGEYNTPAPLVAWIDGPVRVIRRMEGGVEILGLKLKLSGGSDNVFYRNYFYTPIFFSLPPGLSSLLKGSYMIYTIDFNSKFKGSYYFDQVNKTPTIIDGKMDSQEKALDTKTNHNWYAVGGDKGNLIERMIVPAQWRDYVNMTTFYIDDDKEQDPPEDEPGRHQFGFKLEGMFEAPAGKYNYYIYYMVPDKKVTKENVSVWLDILDHPLKIQVQPLVKE